MSRRFGRMLLGPVVKDYGAVRLHEWSVMLPDGRVRTFASYKIMLTQPSGEDSLVTTASRADLPTVIAALRGWLDTHQHRLEMMRTNLESYEQPEGRARLQASLEEAEARPGSPPRKRRTVDESTASQRATYEEEIAWHQQIEEALSALQAR